ncbi:MAG: hypothetical protein JJT78_15765 [Leptospira sp.]|nr:hypothetical protein [Leptospira sp.]
MSRFFLSLLIVCNFVSCLKFAESDLDPNSPFSILLGLSRLQNPTRIEVEARAFYRVNGELPVSFPFLTIQKIERELVDTMNLSEEIPLGTAGTEYFGGYAPDFDGSFRIYFPEPGFYRWNFYQLDQGPPQEYLLKGAGIFEIKSISSSEITFYRELYLEPNQSFNWDRIESVPYQEKRFNIQRQTAIKFLGDQKGYGIFKTESIYPKNLIFFKNGFEYTIHPTLNIVDPQGNWKAYVLEDLPLHLQGSIAGNTKSYDLTISKLLPTPTGVGIIAGNRITDGGDIYSNYYSYELELGETTIISRTTITPRNPSAEIIDVSYVNPINDGFVYREEIPPSTSEFRWDSNFLKPGSTNILLSGAVGQFFDSGGIPDAANIFAKDGILIAKNPLILEEAKILRPDLSTVSPFINHDTSIGVGTNTVFYSATPTTFGLIENNLESPGSPNNRIRFTPYLGNLSILSGTLTLSGGFTLNYYDSASFKGSFGSTTRTIFHIEYNIESGGSSLNAVGSWNHSTENYSSVIPPTTSNFQELEPGYSFNDTFSYFGEACFLQVENLICTKIMDTNRTSPNNSFKGYDVYFSTTTDGINWSSWERLPNWGM